MGLIEEVKDGDTDYVFELMLEDRQTGSGFGKRKRRKNYTRSS